MDGAISRHIETLHAASRKYVLALTGGGTGAAAQLLNVPGGSRTLLEVTVPYHQQALAEYLGHSPDNYCSAATSSAMAQRAHARAAWLAPRERVLGISCTATLATDRPKRGDHRAHLSVHSEVLTRTYSIVLSKGARTREEEETLIDLLLFNALAESQELVERLPVPLRADEALQVETLQSHGLLTALLADESATICVRADGQLTANARRPTLLLPGSFNPIHPGHRGLAEVASRLVGAPLAFELSVTNVDKPTLERVEIDHRLRQFASWAPVWLTRAPTFVGKATLFPGAVFVVGADTASRIIAPRYYQDSEAAMVNALQRIRNCGCSFLVAGRVESGRFLCGDDLVIPEAFRELFQSIPETAFRFDISSTQVRASMQS
ncbi:MAG: hypothetical protein K2R98_32510 [Gemmataceae bacterium]|nr:hypothetical protein [Gemmataceae bacterium]